MPESKAVARIVARERSGPIPVSSAQESFWLLQQLNPKSSHDLLFGLQLRGPLDIGAMELALRAVIRRHESLRTVFVAPDGRPLQVIRADAPTVRLRVIDVPGISDGALRAAIAAEFSEPADLEHGPLLRTALFRIEGADHVLGLSIHHCITDGWSMRLLIDELGEHYTAVLESREPAVPELAVQYPDYAIWQRERVGDDSGDLAYWRDALAGEPPATILPTDRPRSSLRRWTAGELERSLGAAPAADLRALATSERASPFMVGLAAFAAVLARWVGHPDVIIATPVAGRVRPELLRMIGCFINTLPLRIDLRGQETFRQLVRQARSVTLGGFLHQEVAFERIVQNTAPGRGRTDNPFTAVAFSMRQADSDAEWQPWANLQYRGFAVSAGMAADMTLVVRYRPEEIRCSWGYANELFDEPTIGRFADHFERFLTQALAEPDQRLREIPLIGAAERRFLVHDLNDTAGSVPETTLDGLVAAQAALTPDAPAVTCGCDTLTYAELDARVNRLAWLLRDRGVVPECRVAICLERSADLVVALVAVLRSGGVYVPLEPGQPAERLRFLLADSGAQLVLTGRSLLPGLQRPTGVPAICIDELDKPGGGQPAGAPPMTADPARLAYIIYTSGSTGTPKGVAVPHRPAVNLVTWVNSELGIGPADRLLFVTSCGFDLSVYDVFGTLAAGGSMVVATDADLREPDRLLTMLDTGGVTVWNSAPAVLQQVMLLPAAGQRPGASCLRVVMLSGDWIPLSLPDLVRSAFPHAGVISLGGPTETTVWSNFYRIGEVSRAWRSVPYGRPIRNARCYLLDERLEPVAPQIAGDMYVGGDVLARGYADRPGLTAARFVPDPFAGVPGGRMYATGDRGRLAPDGTIEFLGRLDGQVQVRGFRVELGEVEAVLRTHSDVGACAVTAFGPREERALAAYVVGRRREPSPDELRSYLAERLPGYMVPSIFSTLSELPLNPNGKLDRAGLPDPVPSASAHDHLALPSTKSEIAAAEIWQELLGLDQVGLDDNFFEIGGHSLVALQLVVRARERLGADLPGGVLIANQTLRAFAAAVDTALSRDRVTSMLQRLRAQADGPAAVLVHPVGGGVTCYAELAARLAGFDIYAFEARRPPRGTRLSDLAAAYAAELRQSGPTPPYLLGGWSFGGVLAFEMALELAESRRGHPPVVLLDPVEMVPPPGRHEVTGRQFVTAFIRDFAAIAGLARPPDEQDVADPDAALAAALESLHQQGIATGLDLDEFASRYQIFRGNAEMLLAYDTRLGRGDDIPCYGGPVYLVEAEESPTSVDALLPVCSNLAVFRMPGNHFDLVRGENAQHVAGIMARALSEAAEG